MIVRTVNDLKGTKGDVRTENWSSLRFLHREDGMGFTFTDTTLKAGMDQVIWYKNHLEACYVLDGEGTIEDLSTGTVHQLRPGTLYALNNHDRHRLLRERGCALSERSIPPSPAARYTIRRASIPRDSGSQPVVMTGFSFGRSRPPGLAMLLEAGDPGSCESGGVP